MGTISSISSDSIRSHYSSRRTNDGEGLIGVLQPYKDDDHNSLVGDFSIGCEQQTTRNRSPTLAPLQADLYCDENIDDGGISSWVIEDREVGDYYLDDHDKSIL